MLGAPVVQNVDSHAWCDLAVQIEATGETVV